MVNFKVVLWFRLLAVGLSPRRLENIPALSMWVLWWIK
jgi:hypothetical protein